VISFQEPFALFSDEDEEEEADEGRGSGSSSTYIESANEVGVAGDLGMGEEILRIEPEDDVNADADVAVIVRLQSSSSSLSPLTLGSVVDGQS